MTLHSLVDRTEVSDVTRFLKLKIKQKKKKTLKSLVASDVRKTVYRAQHLLYM